jgi:GNAT superfamily N-acetyltransferase
VIGESINVRMATLADLPVLVELRLANAVAHMALDGVTYRIPQRSAVTRYFSTVLADRSEVDRSEGDAILVAESDDGRVIGMVEVLRQPEAPAHQILNPEAVAQVHTVVLPGARCHGIGTALLAAAEKWASEAGITYLSAGIYHRNADAIRFYARHGFIDAGVSRGKRLSR